MDAIPKTARRNSVTTRLTEPPRSLSQSVLRKAKQIVAKYSIIVEPNDDLGFMGTSVELPTVFGDGNTVSECYDETQKALIGGVGAMIESGQRPPSCEARTVQVNIRLTKREKLYLCRAANDLGFESLSDFIRTTILRSD